MNRKLKVLQSALDALRRVSPPDREAWEAARDAYIAEARTLAAEVRASDPPTQRQGWMAAMRTWIATNIVEGKMQLVYKVVIALMVVLGGSVGTVRASQESLPGSLLYPVKLQWEQWRLNAIQDAGEEAVQAMEMAQTRVEEIERLREQGRAVPEAVLAHYYEQVARALAASEELDDDQREQVQAQIAASVEAHLREVQEFRTGDDDGARDALREMTRIMEEIRNRLRTQGEESGLPDDAPGTGGPADDDDSPGDQGDDDDRPGVDDDEDTPGADDDMPGDEDDASGNGGPAADDDRDDDDTPGNGSSPDDDDDGDDDTPGNGSSPDDDDDDDASGNDGPSEGDDSDDEEDDDDDED
jgi:hypothetical protein